MPLYRQCLSCGRLNANGSRCADCAPTQRRDPEERRIRNADRARCKAAVDAWVADHGWNCPGWQRPPHPNRDLTADHVISIANGGGGPKSELAVLCRSCNSRKATSR